ncbi:MAG: transposase [Oligoflexia bacterium]|nr:transposase [Oligoflexia bacterium]
MDEKNMKMAIATFRFGVIAEFVTGVSLDRGEQALLLRQKCFRKYKIPYSTSTTITRSTIKKWISDYKAAGEKIEGLMPRTRKDKGHFRSLDEALQMAIKEILKEKIDRPLTGIALILELQHRKYLRPDEEINLSVLYRYLKKQRLLDNGNTNDRRSFEAPESNVLWQSDIMHGPQVIDHGKLKKSYLVAILDDYSRLIPHAEFYLSENVSTFKSCLKKAVESRGLPHKLYIDNGACYKSLNLEQVASCLKISIIHTPPYVPQGRGKIERWFRFIRDNFIAVCPPKLTLGELNERFKDWLISYHQRVHSVTGETPLDRYRSKMRCVRPAPRDLIDYFRMIDFRRVKKDRTFQLNGIVFEAPVRLIDKRIEVRFHQESIEDVEIFYNDLSYGKASILNKVVNYRISRTKIVSAIEESKIKPSELF